MDDASARMLFAVLVGLRNRHKAALVGNDHIILAERAVDNEQLSVLVPAAYNTHMLVAWVENQIPREGLIPGDLRTIIVLYGGSAPVAYDVLPACHAV